MNLRCVLLPVPMTKAAPFFRWRAGGVLGANVATPVAVAMATVVPEALCALITVLAVMSWKRIKSLLR